MDFIQYWLFNAYFIAIPIIIGLIYIISFIYFFRIIILMVINYVILSVEVKDFIENNCLQSSTLQTYLQLL